MGGLMCLITTMVSFFRKVRLFLVCGLAAVNFCVPAGSAVLTNSAKTLPGSDIFEGTNVVRINITVPEAGMNILRRTQWRGGGGKRPEARATVVEGGRTYSNVAIHLKGAAGSFRPVDERPGLTLNFDKHVKGQNFHGLEKISLNNSNQDPSYISEKLSRELFEKAGVPVPRADYAVVTLNGRLLGLYVLVEGYNKQFLKRYFNKTSGNLYDGGFCQEVTEHLNVNSGDNPDDQSDLRALAAAAAAARENNKLSELSKVLDVDRFITMVAMEILLCHWDGYAMNRNNYRVFSDQESGRFVFMPHGLDQLFGVGGMGSPHTPIQPHMNGLVARSVMGTSEGRAKYLKRLAELRTNILDAAAITARVREIEAKIHPVVAQIRRSAAGHASMVNMLCRNIEIRAENLDQQLSTPARELKFGSNGVAVLTDWKPRNTMTEARFEGVPGPGWEQAAFHRSGPRSGGSILANASCFGCRALPVGGTGPHQRGPKPGFWCGRADFRIARHPACAGGTEVGAVRLRFPTGGINRGHRVDLRVARKHRCGVV